VTGSGYTVGAMLKEDKGGDELEREQQYWREHRSARLSSGSLARIAGAVLRQQSPDKPGLELGCGEGMLLPLLPGAVGIDYVLSGLRVAATTRTPVMCADSTGLPFANARFSYVVTNSLHHMPLERTLAEVRRVLEPGGRFYCVEPNRWHLYRLLSGRGGNGEIAGDTGFFPHRLAGMFRRQGFLVDRLLPIILEVEPVTWRTRLQRLVGRIPISCFQSWFLLSASRG
jgi:SAM-dependent methyltransferase